MTGSVSEPAAAAPSAEAPFVGPRPLEAGEPIYGREDDISELYYFWNAERVVLLCSPSGAGKSSLIQAGLVPRLADSFDVWGPTRVNQESPIPGTNRYVLSTLQGFEEGVPPSLRRPMEHLAELSLSQYVETRPRRRSAPRSIALLFDQFEEILTADPLAKQAKEEFFDQLGELLHNPRIWVLFALREDYLAPLDPYAHRVPTAFKNRFRIDLLSLEGARQAIVEPARRGGRSFPAVDPLVNDLATVKVQQADGSFREETGFHVEPVQLQVVCLRLWNQVPAEQRAIDEQSLQQFGDVTEALAAYYAECVRRVAEDRPADERAIREWFDESLITASGIRKQVLRGLGKSGGLANSLIESLQGTHLIRAEKRAGATWYELAHDRLIHAVQDNNQTWFGEHLSQAQRRSTLWEKQKRPTGLLLRDEDLAQAERWAQHNADTLTELELEFLKESRLAQDAVDRERKQRRRIERQARILMVISMLALLVTGLALNQRRHARIAEKNAEQLAMAATSSSLVGKMPTIARLIALEIEDLNKTPHGWATLYQTLAARRWVILKGHLDPVAEAVFSPDGRRIATASWDDTARIWDSLTGEEMALLSGHADDVLGIAFSPDGSKVVTTSRDGDARVWQTETGEQISQLSGWSGSGRLSFTLDGRHITGSTTGGLPCWKVADGTPQTDRIEACDVAANDPPVAADGEEITQSMLEQRFLELTGKPLDPDSCFISADRSRVVSLNSEKATVWNLRKMRKSFDLKGHTNSIQAAAFNSSGTRLVTASSDQSARIWNIDEFDDDITQGNRAWFSSTQPRMLTQAEQPAIQALIWGIEGREQPLELPLADQEKIQHAAFSRDGTLLATTSEQAAKVWRLNIGQLEKVLPAPATGIGGISLNPSGDSVALIEGSEVLLWNLIDTDASLRLIGHSGPVSGAFFTSDGQSVLTYSTDVDDSTARIWRADDGRQVQVFSQDSAIADAVLSPDGTLVAVAFDDGSAYLWDITTGAETAELEGHLSRVNSIEFSLDGARLVTASEDSTARIWNLAGRQLAVLRGHTGPVYSAEFSPDGSRIVTASHDKHATLWSAENRRGSLSAGEEIADLVGHQSRVTTATFSSDGFWILTSSDDGVTRIWPHQDNLILGLNRARTYSCLQAEFRRKFFDETKEEAQEREKSCRQCVGTFFDVLDGRTKRTAYIEAWLKYEDCLAEPMTLSLD